MKILAWFSATVLLTYSLLSLFPLRGEERIYENTIRLHVIAESDTKEDQAEKLRVRDRILTHLSSVLADTEDKARAEAAVTAELSAIETLAEAETGRDVTVTLEKETYPTREYEGFTLPAGEYTSLKVEIGAASGQNWWCILFPRLCTAKATEDAFKGDFIAAGFTEEQYRLIKEESGTKYKIRFKILEILSALWA